MADGHYCFVFVLCGGHTQALATLDHPWIEPSVYTSINWASTIHHLPSSPPAFAHHSLGARTSSNVIFYRHRAAEGWRMDCQPEVTGHLPPRHLPLQNHHWAVCTSAPRLGLGLVFGDRVTIRYDEIVTLFYFTFI